MVSAKEVKNKDIESYLAIIAKGGAVVSTLLKLFAILLLILGLLPFFLLCLGPTFPLWAILSMEGTMGNAFLASVQMILFVIPIWILSNICQETSRGVPPFSMKQVRRMRVVTVVILLFAAVDLLLDPGSLLLDFNGFLLGGYVHGYAHKINIAALVAALVLFLLSFVFKYGVMLQSVSDDVL